MTESSDFKKLLEDIKDDIPSITAYIESYGDRVTDVSMILSKLQDEKTGVEYFLENIERVLHFVSKNPKIMMRGLAIVSLESLKSSDKHKIARLKSLYGGVEDTGKLF